MPLIKHHGHEHLVEEGVYASLHIPITAHVEGRQGRDVEAGTEDHGGTLLTGLFLIACSACFPIVPQNNHPPGGNTHSELNLPTPITEIHYRLSHKLDSWGHFLL